jgi:hypothetical protein
MTDRSVIGKARNHDIDFDDEISSTETTGIDPPAPARS